MWKSHSRSEQIRYVLILWVNLVVYLDLDLKKKLCLSLWSVLTRWPLCCLFVCVCDQNNVIFELTLWGILFQHYKWIAHSWLFMQSVWQSQLCTHKPLEAKLTNWNSCQFIAAHGSKVRDWIWDLCIRLVNTSGAGPPLEQLNLIPKSFSGPPGTFYGDNPKIFAGY